MDDPANRRHAPTRLGKDALNVVRTADVCSSGDYVRTRRAPLRNRCGRRGIRLAASGQQQVTRAILDKSLRNRQAERAEAAGNQVGRIGAYGGGALLRV